MVGMGQEYWREHRPHPFLNRLKLNLYRCYHIECSGGSLVSFDREGRLTVGVLVCTNF